MTDEPRSSIDDIIDLYKRDVDVSLIRERLKRTVEQRLEDLMDFQRFAEELRRPKDFEAVAEREAIRE